MVSLKEEVRAAVELERRDDGQLVVRRDGEVRPVKVHRCFPWSEPGRFLSLRDEDNEEFTFVASLAELDPESREALEAALVEAGFVLEVRRIVDVEEEVEIRRWRVETEQGNRSFQTKLDDWPTDLPGGGLLIRDVAGDLYRVGDPDALDPKSRKWLWAFVD